MSSGLEQRLGFVGGGVMAEAILSRLIASGTSKAQNIFVREISTERGHYLQSEYGVQPCSSYADLTTSSDVLVLAIKPQIFAKDRQSFVLSEQVQVSCVLSIMAGTSIRVLR